jgi:ABC-type polysaccharide/polyol phosphate export permease
MAYSMNQLVMSWESGRARYGIDPRVLRALSDLAAGVRLWRLWMMLGWVDIRQRYRRAFIGPFWITISMGVSFGGMGLVYGTIFAQDMSSFLPYVAGGLLAWAYVSGSVLEAAAAFTQAEGLIKQGGLPQSIHLFRVMWRNLIVLAHNSVVIVGIYIWKQEFPWTSLSLVVPALVLVTMNLAWISFVIGPVCTRFRDASQIIANIMQMLFLLTPILYKPELLTNHRWIIYLNPFSYMVDALRSPLLGDGLSLSLTTTLLATAIVGWAVAFLFFARTRGRIAFWL